MKVLQVNNYNYLKGGSEKVYQETIKILLANNHDVRYFSTLNSKNENICPGVSVDVKYWKDANNLISKIPLVFNFIYNRKVAKQLDKFIKEFKPDVAHLHIYYGLLSNSIIKVLRKNNIPIVQSVHEYRLLCPAYTLLDSKNRVCERCAKKKIKIDCIIKGCIKNSKILSFLAVFENIIRDLLFNNQKKIDAFIMVSQFINDKHIQYCPKLSSKSFQIYNSVDIDYYKKYIVDINLKEDYYLYFGRLSHEKGLTTLFRVFEKNQNLKLKVAGTGPIEKELNDFVEQNNISNIEFLGFVKGESLYELISKAKFTIVPSEWYENNPLSVIESLVLGTPVIGAKIGGIPEIVIDNFNGYIHESGSVDSMNDCIIKSYNISFDEYCKLCENSKENAHKFFNNDYYYTKLMEVYTKVIEK